jgi:hypothetical protein
VKRSRLVRRTPLRAMSIKRRAETGRRARVREAVLARDVVCVMASESGWGLVRHDNTRVTVPVCWGPLDVHEVVPRGRRPGSHLRAEWCVVLCRGHHGFVHDQPEIGEALGLLVHSWNTEEQS